MLSREEFLQIVAASNFKQRTRMAMLYYHAELRNFAVIGTANKNEHGQGFFVKHGDAAADVMPIGHLYKTQVYQLAEYLRIPPAIRERARRIYAHTGGDASLPAGRARPVGDRRDVDGAVLHVLAARAGAG